MSIMGDTSNPRERGGKAVKAVAILLSSAGLSGAAWGLLGRGTEIFGSPLLLSSLALCVISLGFHEAARQQGSGGWHC